MQKNRGAALLEVIVAIGIVTLVMTTIVSLVSVSLKSASFAQSKTLGTKYSQEGMESLRQMRTVLGWDSFLATLQADGTTIRYCLPTVPRSATEFAALTNAACSSSQFVDAKNLFQRQADITVTTNAGRTSVAITVRTTWNDSGVQKTSTINQQFEQYNVDDAPAPIIYSPLPYIPYGFTAGIWLYRQAIPVTNSSGSALTDYQVMATLNTSSLISANKMQSNCADLRVTTSDGTTNIPYWIEPSTCNTASTKVWIKVPNIPTSGTTLYAIYGNANATEAGYFTTDVFVRNITSLGAAYAMNESVWSGAAGEVKDTSGNNNNGTPTAASITSGKFGNGGLFNGTASLVTVPDSPTVGPTSIVSVAAWLKTTATNVNGVVVGKTTGCATTGYLVWLNENAVGAGKPGFYTNPGGWLVASNVINDNNWHYVVTTFNGATANVYVDGVLSISAARTANLDNVNPLQIGGSNAAGGGCANQWFNGVLDDVQIYDKYLSAAEVTDMFGAGKNQVYSTTNFPSVGLVRKLVGGVSVGSTGAEQVGSYVFSSQVAADVAVVANYKFNEGGGTTVADSSGSGLTGTFAGTGTHWVRAGLDHMAGTFNGAGDGVSLGSPTQLDFGDNGPFTFDGWIKPSLLKDYGGFVSKNTAGRLNPYSYMTVTMANGRLAAYNGANWIDLCPAGSVVQGAWQHIAFSYNGSILNGYVNGNNCGSVPFTYTDNAAYAVWIGSWYSPVTVYDFNGTIDEVKIYSGALTTAQVQADYQAGAAIFNPIFNLAFNDGTGSVISDSGTNNLDGTWVGTGAHWVGSSPNYAGKFNGNGDGVNMGTNALYNLGSSEPFSLEGWVKPAVMKDYAGFISKDAAGRTSPYSYLTAIMADGRLFIYDNVVGWHSICAAGSVTVGNWQHIAITFDGATVNGYVNGVACGSVAGFTYVDTPTHYVNIGSWSNGLVYDFNGLMDQMSMYDYKRSATQILADKNAYTPPASNVWAYRVPITITNTYGSTLSNYQVKTVMNTAALVTAGKMNADCSDLRITASNGTTALPYWVETGTNGCNTAATAVWVKVPSIPTSGVSLYAYYGNGLATTTEDGNQTFDFFDDFSDTTLDSAKWTSSAGAAGYTVSGGILTVLTGSIYSKAPVTASVQNEQFEMRNAWGSVYVYYSGLTLSETSAVAGGNAGASTMAMLQTVGASQPVAAYSSDGVAAGYNLQSAVAYSTPVAATYYITGIGYSPTALTTYKDRVAVNSAATSIGYSPYLSLGFFFGSGAGTQDVTNLFVDFVVARKSVTPAPAAAVSTEQTGTWSGL